MKEWLDRLPIPPEHCAMAALLAGGGLSVLLCASCCGSCVYLFRMQNSRPVARVPTPLPTNVKDVPFESSD